MRDESARAAMGELAMGSSAAAALPPASGAAPLPAGAAPGLPVGTAGASALAPLPRRTATNCPGTWRRVRSERNHQ